MSDPKTKPHKLTTLRKSTAPYLPPPFLRLLHVTDTYFHLHHSAITNDYCNDEPSMAILSALFLAYAVLRSIQGMWVSTTKRSTAHLTGKEEGGDVLGGLAVVSSGKGGNNKRHNGGESMAGGGLYEPPPFQATVVLCGASNSGKTALLHYLCNDANKGKENNAWGGAPMTVASLVANVGYICPSWEGTNSNDNTNNDNNDTIRIIDYPGHPSLSSQLTTLLLPSATSRLVFTIDATQPVTIGASLLYQSILTHSQVRQSWKKEGKTLEVLVACTKSDAKGAKNYKRMKIQLRNELDKLRKVDLAIKESSSIPNNGGNFKAELNVKGKSIDLDDLGSDVPVSLHFVEAGFGMDGGKGGLMAIREFVLKGVLPNV
ncbi:hypothetical protein ACHAXR_003625 [Thalassiosira sp. AJA248-18]